MTISPAGRFPCRRTLPELRQLGSVRTSAISGSLLGGVDAAAVPAQNGSLVMMRRLSFARRCVHELAYTIIDIVPEHSLPTRDGLEALMSFVAPPPERWKGPRSNESGGWLRQYAVAYHVGAESGRVQGDCCTGRGRETHGPIKLPRRLRGCQPKAVRCRLRCFQPPGETSAPLAEVSRLSSFRCFARRNRVFANSRWGCPGARLSRGSCVPARAWGAGALNALSPMPFVAFGVARYPAAVISVVVIRTPVIATIPQAVAMKAEAACLAHFFEELLWGALTEAPVAQSVPAMQAPTMVVSAICQAWCEWGQSVVAAYSTTPVGIRDNTASQSETICQCLCSASFILTSWCADASDQALASGSAVSLWISVSPVRDPARGFVATELPGWPAGAVAPHSGRCRKAGGLFRQLAGRFGVVV